MTPSNWIVGLLLSDGTYDTLDQSESIPPNHIEEVIFPLSLPWIDEPTLYRRSLTDVASDSREQGPETTHSARVEGAVPNTNQVWEVQLDIWEYPRGVFNDSKLRHSEQVRNARWNPVDLIDAMRR